MKLNIGIISIGFPPFKLDIPKRYLEETVTYLNKSEHNLFYQNEVLVDDEKFNLAIDRFKKNDLDLLIVQLGSFSNGDWMAKVIQKFNHVPFLLWGFNDPITPEFPTIPMNSLTSLNMFSSFMYRMKKKFEYIYETFESEETFSKLTNVVKALEVKKELSNAKFAVVGSRVPGFYLSGVDEMRLRREIGCSIVYYSIATLVNDAMKITDEEVEENFKALDVKIENTISIKTVKKSIRIEIALKKYVEENNITGLTIKCWPELQDIYGISACGIISNLNDLGITTSCEGDVTGLITMHILNKITDKPVFFGDLVGKAKNGRLKLWHCGLGPLKLAKDQKDIKYTHQATMRNGIGIGVQYEMITGNVSLCKLSEGIDKYRFFIANGYTVDPDRQLLGVQTDIQLTSDFNSVIKTIMDEGIEHHFALVHEDIKPVIEILCQYLNITYLDCERN